MALYWPEERVALDIVDDPYRRPFEGDESYAVLRVTCADLTNYDSYRKVMARLCEMLGREAPTMPEWEEKHHALHEFLMHENEDDLLGDACSFLPDCAIDSGLSNVQILATSEEEAEWMSEHARQGGQYVRGVSVWEGPVPEGSFRELSETMRMSTPEYYFLRKANELPFPLAVSLGLELCGKYRSVLTQYDRGEGYDFLKHTRTSRNRIRAYLRGARGTKEGKRAKRVLRHVSDECCSPMCGYLYVLLCLPRSSGSYGVERGLLSCVFQSDHGYLPDSAGDYLAYDLCWPDKKVALQYTGSHAPSQRNLSALQVHDMRVLCVTDDDIRDEERFDAIAQRLMALLDALPPKPTEKWRAARERLRAQVPVPRFPHMQLTMDDFGTHAIE